MLPMLCLERLWCHHRRRRHSPVVVNPVTTVRRRDCAFWCRCCMNMIKSIVVFRVWPYNFTIFVRPISFLIKRITAKMRITTTTMLKISRCVKFTIFRWTTVQLSVVLWYRCPIWRAFVFDDIQLVTIKLPVLTRWFEASWTFLNTIPCQKPFDWHRYLHKTMIRCLSSSSSTGIRHGNIRSNVSAIWRRRIAKILIKRKPTNSQTNHSHDSQNN